VDAITIQGQTVTFTANGASYGGEYVSDGYEVLTYKKGNRGVRYVFAKESGDALAPAFIQFSDHHIAPKKVSHYHLYWGDDRAEVLKELTNWPTYFPASYSGDDIVHDMIAH
jgi:zinc transport system substrate-binding protein